MPRGAGLKIGRVLGIPIYLHSSWFLIFALITYSYASELALTHAGWSDQQRWAVLYLGSAKAAALLPERDIVVVNKNGNAVDRQDQALREIEGIILLDGTWSQAKALWWRNAWMLKCKRVVLGPKQPSRYGRLRREPRGDGLSTIEAAAMLLARLERKPEIETALHATFERLLARYRETHPDSGGRRRR